jgi:hypothetical protein
LTTPFPRKKRGSQTGSQITPAHGKACSLVR